MSELDYHILELETKPRKLVLQTSLIYAFYMLLLTYVMYFVGIDGGDNNLPLGTKLIYYGLSYIPFTLGIFYAQKSHREQLGGTLRFGRAFSIGMKIAALSGLLLGLLLILYYKVLNVEAFDLTMQRLEESMLTKPEIDDSQVESAMSITKKYFSIFLLFGTEFGMVFVGAIVSLIGSFIFKKEQPIFTSTEE